MTFQIVNELKRICLSVEVTEQEVLVFAIKRLDDQRQRIDELEHRLGINHFKAPVDPRDRVRA